MLKGIYTYRQTQNGVLIFSHIAFQCYEEKSYRSESLPDELWALEVGELFIERKQCPAKPGQNSSEIHLSTIPPK